MNSCWDNSDYCGLLPNTPASEVTKEIILQEIYDFNIIGPETDPPPLTYLKSLYWTVMTLLTVGYGDMSLPGNDDIQQNSNLGYWILVFEIMTILVAIPTTASSL